MISVCMIVKNEEQWIAGSLISVKNFVDEIIVVDTGSTDQTAQIARELGAQVFEYAWDNDFSAARNFSIGKAHGDWILFLDADECIAPQDAEKIEALCDNTELAGYIFIQRNYTNDRRLINFERCTGAYGQLEQGAGFVPVQRIALFRNDPRIRFSGIIHETVGPAIAAIDGVVGMTDIAVHHYGHLNSALKDKKADYYLLLGLRQIELSPDDPKPYNDIAVIHTSRGDYDCAEQYFLRVYELNPQYDAIAYNIAMLYFKWRRFDDALRYLDCAESDSAYRVRSILARAVIYDAQGHHDRAEQVLRDGFIQSKNESLQENFGLIVMNRHKYDEAQHIFLELLDLHPETMRYAEYLIQAYAGGGDFDSALIISELYSERCPGNGRFALWCMRLYIQLQKWDLFLKIFNRCEHEMQHDGEYMLFNAIRHELNGNVRQAVAAYRDSVQMSPVLAPQVQLRLNRLVNSVAGVGQ